MKCPNCGFNSFNYLRVCKKCGAGLNPKSDYIPGTSNTPEALIRIHNQAPAGPAADYDDNESDERPFISYEITGADSVEDSGKSDFEDIYIGEDPNQTFGSPIPAGYVEEFGPHKRENEYVVSRNSSYEAEIIDNSSDDGISAIKDKSEVPDERNISKVRWSERPDLSQQDNVWQSTPDAVKDEKGDRMDSSQMQTAARFGSGEIAPYELASLNSRAAAIIIDVVIVVLTAMAALVCGLYILGAAGGMLYRDQNMIFSLFTGLLIMSSSYFLILQSYGGKTIGKMIIGIRLINYDGEPVGFQAAFLRWVGYYISAIFIFFGFIWPVFDSEYQAWHDKIAGTYVIKD